jgi:ASF1 like histone chaperone
MAAVDIFDVKVLDNPAPFTNPLQFEITYDVREPLKEGRLSSHFHMPLLFLEITGIARLTFSHVVLLASGWCSEQR